VKFIKTDLQGVFLIEPKVHADARGFFLESYNEREFVKNGINVRFVQDNMSRSVKGTLRGLHYQLDPHSQGKLVRVLQGEVFDVAVDIRQGSPTYGKWFGHTLTAENKLSLYIPPGFAHGFLVLTDTAEFIYKCTSLYEQKAERGIIWNDAKISIKWPATPDPTLLSDKDRQAPPLDKAEINFVYK
jgi:dTDP-4-dehydrorhamnose 3,5-epimerase